MILVSVVVLVLLASLIIGICLLLADKTCSKNAGFYGTVVIGARAGIVFLLILFSSVVIIIGSGSDGLPVMLNAAGGKE